VTHSESWRRLQVGPSINRIALIYAYYSSYQIYTQTRPFVCGSSYRLAFAQPKGLNPVLRNCNWGLLVMSCSFEEFYQAYYDSCSQSLVQLFSSNNIIIIWSSSACILLILYLIGLTNPSQFGTCSNSWL